jgi:Tat protein secretion system quality control protein TatD with DNase activity
MQKMRQKHWFEAQAELALKYDLPVVIHTRNCSEKTIQALKDS